jgi:hypothetical protein
MHAALFLGLFGLTVLGVAAANAQQYTPYPIAGGVKVCSAVVPSNWRNDLPVPKSWSQQTVVIGPLPSELPGTTSTA